MNDLLCRRRAMMGQKVKEEWDYVFTAGEDGFVPKGTVEVSPGDHVIIVWDLSRYKQSPSSRYQTAYAANKPDGSYARPSEAGLSGTFPICCDNIGDTNIFRLGRNEFICGESVGKIVLGYWGIATIDRDYRLYGNYIKIKITKGESS